MKTLFHSSFTNKNKIIQFFYNNWGLFILSFLLLLISVVNLSLHNQLIGWDNFSVSLNFQVNFLRTFFSSWREYRGLGVVSDSEVTDIFRQLFLWPFSVTHREIYFESTYYLTMLAFGVIGSYWLVRVLVKALFDKMSLNQIEISGLVGGLAYACSLHAIGTFYLPISMYVTRFGLLPLFTYLFMRVISSKKISITLIASFLIVSLLLSAAYVTATVFVTICLVLSTLVFAYPRRSPKIILLGVFFLMLNGFWLLPFANYTKQKSHLLPLASTFIEVNEIQLNQPVERFSWDRLLAQLPSYYYTNYTSLDGKDSLPIFNLITNNQVKNALFMSNYVVMVMSLIGIVAVILKIGKSKPQGLWLVILLCGSLFLLRKELPPTGFIYDGLGEYIPLIKVVFRFGGEKFYPLLSLAIVGLSGVGIATLIHIAEYWYPKVHLKVWVPLSIGLIFFITAPYFFFYNGRLFSPLVTTQIPPQYYEVAELINHDHSFGRVLHLPMDKRSYWKTYSWGYIGSAFFNFMIEKPLVDRTWEPASLEMDELHQTLQTLLYRFSELTEEEQLARAKQFASIMERTQIRYVIFDESVDVEVPAKNGIYFGSFNGKDSLALKDKLLSLNLGEKVYDQPISGARDNNNAADHLTIVKTNSSSFEPIGSITNSITLSSFADQVWLHPQQNNEPATVIQFDGTQEVPQRMYPFFQRNGEVSVSNELFNFTLPFNHQGNLESSPVSTTSGQLIYRLIASYSEVTSSLQVDLIPITEPFFENERIKREASGQFIFKTPLNFKPLDHVGYRLSNQKFATDLSDVKLVVNDQVFSVPRQVQEAPTIIGEIIAVSTSSGQVSARLLKFNQEQPLSASSFGLSDDPNCFKDKQTDYAYGLEYKTDSVHLTSLNGTTCLTSPVGLASKEKSNYWEIVLNAKVNGQHDATKIDYKTPSFWQAKVHDTVSSLTPYAGLNLCLIDPSTGFCLNRHTFWSPNNENTVLLQPERYSTGLKTPQIMIGLPISPTKLELELKNGRALGYEVVAEQTIDLNRAQVVTQRHQVEPGESLTVSIPIAHSDLSLLWQAGVDGWRTYVGTCPTSFDRVNQGWGGFYETEQLPLLVYQSKCPVGVYQTGLVKPNTFGMWVAEYALFSGKVPQFGLNSLSDEQYLSRYQNFRDVTEQKSLQKADSGFGANEEVSTEINQLLKKPTWQTAYLLFNSLGQKSTRETVFAFSHNSENQGVVAYQSMNLVELPVEWRKWYIQTGDPVQTFAEVNIDTSTRIIPAWWQSEVRLTDSEQNQDRVLIKLNQAYDQGWHVYQTDTWWELLFNQRRIQAVPVKVDGWAMGFIIPTDQLSRTPTTISFFHDQERLSWIGWGVTVTTIISSLALVAIYSALRLKKLNRGKAVVLNNSVKRTLR